MVVKSLTKGISYLHIPKPVKAEKLQISSSFKPTVKEKNEVLFSRFGNLRGVKRFFNVTETLFNVSCLSET